jgi:hypothetical protein
MMSAKYESADLILKLYEARREETMRKARDWFVAFLPNSAQEIIAVFMGPQSGYFRMVTTYWDMAASFVNNGAIDEQMFNDANMEHLAVFAKVEPFIEEIRATYVAPAYLKNLEQLVMRRPGAKEQLATTRERLRAIVEQRRAGQEKEKE